MLRSILKHIFFSKTTVETSRQLEIATLNPGSCTPIRNQTDLSNNTISGRRIVDIMHFFNEVNNFKHVSLFSCDNTHLKIVKEMSVGFHSTFTIKCSVCHEEKRISTDESGPRHINESMVLGMISTGGGCSQMQEIFSYCNVPVMSNHTYLKTESKVANAIHETAWEEMKDAGEKEKTIAIENGRVDADGIPYITVIVDGAWSKRSYRVNYNALSGVVSILFT